MACFGCFINLAFDKDLSVNYLCKKTYFRKKGKVAEKLSLLAMSPLSLGFRSFLPAFKNSTPPKSRSTSATIAGVLIYFKKLKH